MAVMGTLGMDSFMESYRQNINIKGSDNDLAAFFEGVEPCTYEEAVESFFEAQYSTQAMAAITENAIMMESAGAAEFMNEGVVSSFASAAWEKIKECATKVKQFAMAVIEKIKKFFAEMYAKATPIDKAMQMYGKKGIEFEDIKKAVAAGYKVPESVKLLSEDAESTVKAIIDASTTDNAKGLLEAIGKLKARSANVIAGTMSEDAKKDLEDQVEDIKKTIAEQKEKDKELFTMVGQLLNDTPTKKDRFKELYKKSTGSITSSQWNVIKDFALNGQSKMRTYQADTQKEAKAATKEIEDLGKDVQKAINDKSYAGSDNGVKAANANKAAAMNKLITTEVQAASYLAKRSVTVMNSTILPLMRKMHSAAISSYISISSGVKSQNRKTDKANKI